MIPGWPFPSHLSPNLGEDLVVEVLELNDDKVEHIDGTTEPDAALDERHVS